MSTIHSLPSCLFCKIASGAIPVQRLYEDDNVLAFPDINPQAPTHVLVIPRAHHQDVAALSRAGEGLLDEVLAQAHEVAKAEGVSETGYRVVFNTGPDAGQTVPHAHAHVLGGRPLTWPPG